MLDSLGRLRNRPSDGFIGYLDPEDRGIVQQAAEATAFHIEIRGAHNAFGEPRIAIYDKPTRECGLFWDEYRRLKKLEKAAALEES